MINKITFEPSQNLKKLGDIYKFIAVDGISLEYEYRVFLLSNSDTQHSDITALKNMELSLKIKQVLTLDDGSTKKSERSFYGYLTHFINRGRFEAIPTKNGERSGYIYELILRPPTLLNELKLYNTRFENTPFLPVIEALFNNRHNDIQNQKEPPQNISITDYATQKYASVFAGSKQAIFQQNSETNLQSIKRFCYLFGVNYSYKKSGDSYAVELESGLNFSSSGVNSQDITAIKDLRLELMAARVQNESGQRLPFLHGASQKDELEAFFDKNDGYFTAQNTRIYGVCADLNVDIFKTINIKKEQFGGAMRARVSSTELVATTPITTAGHEYLPREDYLQNRFAGWCDGDEYGYIGDRDGAPSSTAAASGVAAGMGAGAAGAGGAGMGGIGGAGGGVDAASNAASSGAFSAANSIGAGALAGAAASAAITHLANASQTPSPRLNIAVVVGPIIDDDCYYNRFEAKIFQGDNKPLGGSQTVHMVMPMGGDGAFYYAPKKDDVVLISAPGDSSEYYLQGYLMKVYKDGKLVDASMFSNAKNTDEKNSGLYELMDEKSWTHGYYAKRTKHDEKDSTADEFDTRRGSAIALGKVKEYDGTVQYYKFRNLKKRKNGLYKLLTGQEIAETKSAMNAGGECWVDDARNAANSEDYRINMDTSGVINMDADRDILAHAGNDMILAGKNIYIASFADNYTESRNISDSDSANGSGSGTTTTGGGSGSGSGTTTSGSGTTTGGGSSGGSSTSGTSTTQSVDAITGDIELLATNSITLKVGKSELKIDDLGITITSKDSELTNISSSITLDPISGITIKSPKISVEGRYSTSITADGVTIGAYGGLLSLMAPVINSSSLATATQIANGVASCVDCGLDLTTTTSANKSKWRTALSYTPTTNVMSALAATFAAGANGKADGVLYGGLEALAWSFNIAEMISLAVYMDMQRADKKKASGLKKAIHSLRTLNLISFYGASCAGAAAFAAIESFGMGFISGSSTSVSSSNVTIKGSSVSIKSSKKASLTEVPLPSGTDAIAPIVGAAIKGAVQGITKITDSSMRG